jgi:hypothetical protein
MQIFAILGLLLLMIRLPKGTKKRLLFRNLLPLFIISAIVGIALFPFFKKALNSTLLAPHLTAKQEARKIYDACSKLNNPLISDRTQCYQKEFYKLTMQRDVKSAYDTIFELQKLDNYAKGCHLIAHSIGWAAYDKNPENWEKTHTEIPKTCNFGAIHGVIERYSGINKGSLLDKKLLQSLCSKEQGACIHIVGHLLLVETGNDLEQSKELCSSFSTNNENRSDCLQGVYMEHMVGSNLLNHGLISKERRENWFSYINEFEDLCRAQTGERSVACWGVISLAANYYFDKNMEEILQFCSSAQNEEAASYCRRVAVGVTGIEWEQNLSDYNACDLPQPNDPTFKKDCIVILVNTLMASVSAENSKRVVDFCTSLPNSEQEICFQTINNSFARLSVNNQFRKTVCGYFKNQYYSSCMNADIGNKQKKQENNFELIDVVKNQF